MANCPEVSIVYQALWRAGLVVTPATFLLPALELRHVIAEVHNTYGERHAYLLPPADLPVTTAKEFYVSPFNEVDGHYLVQAPRPDGGVDITVALQRGPSGTFPMFTATTVITIARPGQIAA